jgi:hypothetical protein
MRDAPGHTIESVDEDFYDVPNLRYLAEHGLCRVEISEDSGLAPHWLSATITAKGTDYLLEDGGLGAELNAVTIRLHPDTIRELLAAQIEASDLPPERKSALMEHLGSASRKVLADGFAELLREGFRRAPAGVEWLRTLAGI